MEGTNVNRTFRRLQTRSAGKHIQFSTVDCSGVERVNQLHKKINDTTSDREKAHLTSMLCLLNELMVVTEMPLDICFDDYLAKLPEEYQPKAKRHRTSRQSFRESLLQERRGLPVIIVSLNVTNPKPHVILMDHPVSNTSFIEGLNNVLSENEDTVHLMDELTGHFKNVMELFNSRRQRAAAICMLSLIFSTTALRNSLGLNENYVSEIKKTVLGLTQTIAEKEEEVMQCTISNLSQLVEKLEGETEREQESINKMLSSGKEVEYAKFKLKNKQERVSRIKKNSKKMARKAAQKEVKKWKETLLSQKGKGKGKYRIDRGAEEVVYRALCEQLAAHDKRKGNPDTSYVHQRKHSKDLQMIANKWLKENGKALMKSASTIRSWAAPRNKRYRSAQDHRGQALWKFSRRSEKKDADRHINIHYNRTHMKNYTRFCFSNTRPDNFKKYVIRRAIDDKAYLRCGTSEGFSRPLHKPVTLTNPALQKHLPAYDFPTEAGYVAPGVIQIIEDMQETDDKYSITSNVIEVVSKPKLIYSSSATNWMNDLYATRLRFPEQHEIDTGTEPLAGSKERTALSNLVFLENTLVQYLMMDIPEDYMEIAKGGEYLDREALRHNVLQHRVDYVVTEIESMQQFQHLIPRMKEFSTTIQDFLEQIPSLTTEQPEDIDATFSTVSLEVQEFLEHLRKENLPRHRPVDIQSSDAGPGVGTSEKLVRIRNAEYFMVNDLDLQCRMHYAPRDSKMHSVEKIMSTLNEAAGDGTSIEVQRPTLYQEIGEDRLLQMSINDFKEFEIARNKSIAKDCAHQVTLKYQGVKCRGTVLNARTPNYDPYMQFFFDEKYMKECATASPTALQSIPGCHYYQMVSNFIAEHYIIYDNGMEGIRDACKENPCQYHVNVERGFEFSTAGIERVPGPVPDYSSTKFSYLKPNDIKAGNITPEFGIDVDAIASNDRQPDDFCPRTQFHQLSKECGQPALKVSEHRNEDGSISYHTTDENDTVQKMKDRLPNFILKYVGEDLKDEVYDYMEHEYMKKVKMAIRKKENQQVRQEEDAKGVEDIDWKTLVTSATLNTLKVAQLDLYLMDIIGRTPVQVRRAGYLKKDKIMDITSHFYMNKGKIFTRGITNTLNLTVD